MSFVFMVMPEMLTTEKLRLSNNESAFLIHKMLNEGHFACFLVASKKNPLSSQSSTYSKQSNLYFFTVGLTDHGWQIISLDNLENICAITKLEEADPRCLFKMLNEQGFLTQNLLLPNEDDVDNDPLCKRFYELAPYLNLNSNIKLSPSTIPKQLINRQRFIFGIVERSIVEKMLFDLANRLPQEDGYHPRLFLFRESTKNPGTVMITYIEKNKCYHEFIIPRRYTGDNKSLTTKQLLEIAQGKIAPLSEDYSAFTPDGCKTFNFSLDNMVFPDLNSVSNHRDFENMRVEKTYSEKSVHISSVSVTYSHSHKIIFSSHPQPEVTKKELQIVKKKAPTNENRNFWLICSTNSIDNELVIISCDKLPETIHHDQLKAINNHQSDFDKKFKQLMFLCEKKGFDPRDMIFPLENEATVHPEFKRYVKFPNEKDNHSKNFFLFRELTHKDNYWRTKRTDGYQPNYPNDIKTEIACCQTNPSGPLINNHNTSAFFPSLNKKPSQENTSSESICPQSEEVMTIR